MVSGNSAFSMSLNYVYEGGLVSGDVMRPVVSGTVNPVVGRYGAGLEFLPNAALNLGQFKGKLNVSLT